MKQIKKTLTIVNLQKKNWEGLIILFFSGVPAEPKKI